MHNCTGETAQIAVQRGLNCTSVQSSIEGVRRLLDILNPQNTEEPIHDLDKVTEKQMGRKTAEDTTEVELSK